MLKSILGSWLPWSNWSKWSNCFGGKCGRIGERSKTRKRIPYSRKNKFSKTYPHLVNITRVSFHDRGIKTTSTGTIFGMEETQEKVGRCTIIGYCP